MALTVHTWEYSKITQLFALAKNKNILFMELVILVCFYYILI